MKLDKVLVLSMVCLFALCGCSWLGLGGGDQSDADKDDQKNTEALSKIKKIAPICPQVAIVRDLMEIYDFGREEKRTPENLVAAGRMDAIQGDCAYRDDGIDIKFELSFVGLRGPGLGGLHTSFPYFIAVVDPNQNILNKNQMKIEFGFSSDEKTANTSETLHVFIPLNKDQQKNGPDYQVLAGFQLPQEQADSAEAK